MNTPLDHEPEDLCFAEYVLGVLDADARAEVEREIATDTRAAAEVARWQRHLLPLAEDIPASSPPAHVWTRLQDQLGLSQPSRPVPTSDAKRRGLWNDLTLWRGFAFGAGVVAAACVIALIVLPRTPLSPSAPLTYMASTITQTDGQVGWTATMDLQHARMVVVPAKPQALPSGRAPELWLIPAGQKPIAVGMLATDAATTIQLDKALVAHLGPTAALAISVEPPGGSPTGQPTGPVIAKGAIGAAQNSGKPLAMLYRSDSGISGRA